MEQWVILNVAAYLKGDSFARQGLHKDLHCEATTKA